MGAIKGFVWEDGGATTLARILGLDGDLIVQADVSTITCLVYDITSAASIITPTVTVASAVFDTLQTDARWSVDTTGFNFSYALPATAFPTGEHDYRIEYKFTPASGAAYFVVYQVHSREVYTS